MSRWRAVIGEAIWATQNEMRCTMKFVLAVPPDGGKNYMNSFPRSAFHSTSAFKPATDRKDGTDTGGRAARAVSSAPVFSPAGRPRHHAAKLSQPHQTLPERSAKRCGFCRSAPASGRSLLCSAANTTSNYNLHHLRRPLRHT